MKRSQKGILVINPYNSFCGDCGLSADPEEKSHITKLGYHPGKGCGAKWTKVSTDYIGGDIEKHTQETRPDLEFVNNLAKDEE